MLEPVTRVDVWATLQPRKFARPHINEKFGNDSHTTYAVIKINLHKYKYEIQSDGRILIKNKIRITSGNIVEMYFTLPPSQDIGEVIQDLF